MIAGRPWRDIPPELFLTACPSPFLLSDEEFLRVLPGFLVAAVTHLDDSLFVGSLLGKLQPPRAPDKLRQFAEKFGGLSPSQHTVVVRVMKYIRRVADYRHKISKQIDRSLAGYWEVS